MDGYTIYFNTCLAWDKIVLPVPEDDLPLPLPLLPALPLVCQGGGGDLYGEGKARFKPGAKPGGRKVARFCRQNK